MNLDSFWSGLPGTHVDMRELDTRVLAGVLVAITDVESDPQIILTQRAKKMTTHGGQVAFPGGRWEPVDTSLVDTALRESMEEVALPIKLVEVRGRLTTLPSLHGLSVYPFVATVPDNVQLVPNPLEIAEIFRVPLSFLLEQKPDRIDNINRHGLRVQVPAWNFQGYEIWGLTAMILQEMLDLIRQRGSGDE